MKLFASVLIAVAMLTGSSVAMAQHDHGDRGDRDGRGWHDDRDHGRDHDRDHRDYGRYDHEHDRGRGHDRYWVPPGHRWERGHRYDGPTYVVRDYRTYRLRPPPRGYHWVRGDDGQYLLVAIATGIILDIALH